MKGRQNGGKKSTKINNLQHSAIIAPLVPRKKTNLECVARTLNAEEMHKAK